MLSFEEFRNAINRRKLEEVAQEKQDSKYKSRLSFWGLLNCLRRFCDDGEDEFKPLVLPPLQPEQQGMKTIVIDLENVLIQTFVQLPEKYDFSLKVQIDMKEYQVYVMLRPAVKDFLKFLSMYFEVIIFTTAIKEFANPIIDIIDPLGVVSQRVFRENCTNINGNIIKNLTTLNRNLKNVIVLESNTSLSSSHPHNVIGVKPVNDDPFNHDLKKITHFLFVLQDFKDVRPLQSWYFKYNTFKTFSYINQSGQKVRFQIGNDIIEEQDEFQTFSSPSRSHQKYIHSIIDEELSKITLKEKFFSNRKKITKDLNRSVIVQPDQKSPISLDKNKESQTIPDEMDNFQIEMKKKVSRPSEQNSQNIATEDIESKLSSKFISPYSESYDDQILFKSRNIRTII